MFTAEISLWVLMSSVLSVDKCCLVCRSIFLDNSYASISASFCPQLFHLSFSLQQSTNSLPCQSKLTFMQQIFNDMIHLALSLISSLPLPSCWMCRATRSLITIQCCIHSLVGYRMDYQQPTNLNCNVSL